MPEGKGIGALGCGPVNRQPFTEDSRGPESSTQGRHQYSASQMGLADGHGPTNRRLSEHRMAAKYY